MNYSFFFVINFFFSWTSFEIETAWKKVELSCAHHSVALNNFCLGNAQGRVSIPHAPWWDPSVPYGRNYITYIRQVRENMGSILMTTNKTSKHTSTHWQTFFSTLKKKTSDSYQVPWSLRQPSDTDVHNSLAHCVVDLCWSRANTSLIWPTAMDCRRTFNPANCEAQQWWPQFNDKILAISWPTQYKKAQPALGWTYQTVENPVGIVFIRWLDEGHRREERMQTALVLKKKKKKKQSHFHAICSGLWPKCSS